MPKLTTIDLKNSYIQAYKPYLYEPYVDPANEIPNYAFMGYASLVSIILPFSVKSIGIMAFSDCVNLKSVTFGEYVVSMGESTFSNCSSLTYLTSNFVNTIGGSCFKNCTKLESVVIGNSVKSIGDFTFSGCLKLASINLPSTLSSIGIQAFKACGN